ncbi:MAG TPA: polysaccharide deacetylase family protein [Actinopolymorphaceae bacterium]
MSEERWLTHLCFHGIGVPRRSLEDGEARYWIDRDALRWVLDLAAADPNVRVSFDDGNASDIEIGLEELLQRGLRASFFPLAGRLNKAGSLGAADVRALADAGMQIGSHGFHHRSWREMSDDELQTEFDEARCVLADAAGGAINTAACPRGAYDRQVLRALRRRDYTTVFTSDRASGRRGAWVQPRFSVRAIDKPADIQAHIDHRKSYVLRATASARVLTKSLR